MNSRSSNILQTGYWQQQHTYEVYDDVSYGRIHVSSISLVPRTTPAVVGPMDPFWSIQDRSAYMMPAFARATSQPPMQNLPRHTDMPRDLHPRPRFTHQSSRTTNPISTADDQNKGVEKLRREVYNPGLSQYNNDDDYNCRAKSQEDGKRCAVCLEDFEPREMVTLTPCHHMFHDKCIVPWVKSRGQCPVCRFVMGDPTKDKEREGNRTSNNGGLRNEEAFEREFISFIRAMEARG